MSALLDAVIECEFKLIDMGAVLDAFDELAGDNSPPWLLVMMNHVKAVNQAFDAVSVAARETTVTGNETRSGVLQ